MEEHPHSPSNWPAGARMPIPGNAEWVLWFLMMLLVAIVCWIADALTSAA